MDKARKAKVNNSLRPMYVKDILLEYSDENHYLTVNEILYILKSRYDLATTRKTLYDDIDLLIDAGYDIECVKAKQNQYHMLSREFDMAELRILIDSVESLKSIPLAKSRELAEKLSKFAGPSADLLVKHNNAKLHPRSENSQVFYIIDAIYSGIASQKQIAFKYYDYVTSSGKAMKNKGKAYQVSPYRLVFNSDYYYLLGYCEKHKNITVFRVDRISGIPKITDESIVPEPENLSVDKYIKESFRMMSGDTTEIVLEFNKKVIDAVADRFGQDMNISFIGKDMCRATVTVQPNNIFFAWLFGFDGQVRIKEPEDVYMQYVRMVTHEMARL